MGRTDIEMKVGLVLEGGALRGMYTAGVLDVLMDNNIDVDAVVGVSAGALFGVNYLSKQRGRVIRYNKRFNQDKDYLGLRPLLREGNIVNTEYAYHRVPEELDVFDDETFKASGVPFYAVVTNMKTGEAEYIHMKSVFDQMDTLRASGSMPFLSKPVLLDGEKYLDGAIADSIPFKFMQQLGCDKIIVVLTQDISYRKKPMSPAMIRLWYGKYREFAKSLSKRHEMYNNTIEELKELEKKEEIFVFRPSRPIEIGRIESDPDKLQEVYDLGIADGVEGLERLKAYLEK